jgi:hypothetical protein
MHVARRQQKRNVYRVLVGGPEGNRPLGRPRRKEEDNIKVDLRGTGWGRMDWINLAPVRDQWRVLSKTVMNFRLLKSVGKFLSSCAAGGFSRRTQPHRVS